MFRAKLSTILLVVVCLFSSYRLFAFDDWQPINPEELKMTADATHKENAIILYHEETADDMTRHHYIYMRMKILTEKGKDLANVEIPYDGSEIGISDIKARTISPDGTITPFSGKALNSTIEKTRGVKYMAKTFSLPNVQVGSIIEWKYTEFWENFVYAPHWVVQDAYYQKRAKFTFVPFLKAGSWVEDKKTGDIKDRVFYSLVGLPGNTQIKDVGGNGRMELELKDIPAYVEEDFAPPSAVMKMRVDFYYGDNKMLKPQEYWKSEGKFWNKDIESFAGHSGAVAGEIGKIVSPSDTAEQKARKIYAYVQKIKNLTYASREERISAKAELDPKQKHTVDDVIRMQKGLDDEIVRAYWALARAASLPAYLMQISDRDRYFFQVNSPNPAQLTSEIVIVMVDGKEVFLDPGTPFCPYGHLSWRHNSTGGVRQTADGSTATVNTPGASFKDAISKRVGNITLDADGSAKGQIAVAWAGEDALVHRLRGLRTDDAGRKKELEDELKASLPDGATVELEKTTGWDDAESQLNASFTVTIPSYASNTGKRMLVPSNMFQTHSRQPFSSGERKQPVYFRYPFYTTDNTQITFPASFQMESITPDGDPLKTAYSLYKIKHSVNGNTVTISRDFAMAEIGFQQKDYPELRKFYDGVTSHDSEQLVLSAAK